LEVDLLNDETRPIRAFDVNVGEVGPGELARFRVYAATDDPRLYRDVSHETKLIDVRIQAPTNGRDVAGRLRFDRSNPGGPVLIYAPDRQTREDRVAFLDFTYHCRYPGGDYHTRFMLTIRGTARPEPTTETAQGALDAVDFNPSESVVPLTDEAATVSGRDLGVDLSFYPGGFYAGESRALTVYVKNHGEKIERDALVQVAVPAPLVIRSWREPRESSVSVAEGSLLFRSAPIPPGGTASLLVAVEAVGTGSGAVEAELQGADENPLNDRDQTLFTVVTAPGSVLRGAWERVSLNAHGLDERIRLQYTVTGALKVENLGGVDAGASRLALFLSHDAGPGPEDVLLGFADTPPLAAGESTSVPVTYLFTLPRTFRPRHVIAVLDSSNYVYEYREGDRPVASDPLR
jgi:hypothetical protein